jgi:hypothetical protein
VLLDSKEPKKKKVQTMTVDLNWLVQTKKFEALTLHSERATTSSLALTFFILRPSSVEHCCGLAVNILSLLR